MVMPSLSKEERKKLMTKRGKKLQVLRVMSRIYKSKSIILCCRNWKNHNELF